MIDLTATTESMYSCITRMQIEGPLATVYIERDTRASFNRYVTFSKGRFIQEYSMLLDAYIAALELAGIPAPQKTQDDSDLWDGVGGGGPLPEDRLMPPSVEVLENIAQIILRSKNHWMDRAVKAEKEVTRLRSAINEALDSAAGDSLHRHPISEDLREYWVILCKALET